MVSARLENGEFRPTPWWDWSDIINLDYKQPALRKYMTEAMADWVREVDIDDYRCDVAGFVPVDFWNNLRKELNAIRPGASDGVFLLAECESRDLHAEAFDATYAWSWSAAMYEIAMGRGDVNNRYVYYSWNEAFFPRGAMRMTFVSNHDQNAWEGTEFEHFADRLPAAMVLSFVGEGMPLIYNGREAGNPRRLKFFEKDLSAWREHPSGALYADLIRLRKKNHRAVERRMVRDDGGCAERQAGAGIELPSSARTPTAKCSRSSIFPRRHRPCASSRRCSTVVTASISAANPRHSAH